MPRYFFDSHNGQLHVRDDLGLELSDLNQAKKTASRTLGDMVRDAALAQDEPRELSVNVRDRSNRVLATASATFRLDETDR